MARYFFAAPFLFAFLLGITSCGPYKKRFSTSTQAQEAAATACYSDLPLPVGTRIIEQKQLPLGPGEHDGCQTILKAYSIHLDMDDLAQFYIAHLELHGWQVEPLVRTATLMCLTAHMPHKRCVVLVEPANRKRSLKATSALITLCVRESHA